MHYKRDLLIDGCLGPLNIDMVIRIEGIAEFLTIEWNTCESLRCSEEIWARSRKSASHFRIRRKTGQEYALRINIQFEMV